MYIAFFLLLAFLGYGGLFWRDRPVILVLSIVACSLLMLVPMTGDIVITTDFGGTMTGSGSDVTNQVAGGSDDFVLLSLEEDWEYSAWVWLHLLVLLIHSTVFIRGMLEGNL